MAEDYGLDTSAFAGVFDAIVTLIKAEAKLSDPAVVKRWIAWDGTADDGLEFVDDTELPGIELRPSVSGEDFYGPGSQQFALVVDVIIHVPGTKARNAANLWRHVRKALRPTPAVRNALKAAGATPTSGEVQFTSPSFAPLMLQGAAMRRYRMMAFGQIKVPVAEDLG